MIPIQEAENILDTLTFNPETEEVELPNALGRILAHDIISPLYMPPFDKSAMDGYAVASDDNSRSFHIVDTIPAGTIPQKRIEKGECAKIMTGAMLPPGTDRVIKKEVTREQNGYIFLISQDLNKNVCLLGEDIKPGDMALPCGTLLQPPHIGIIASMGLSHCCVFKKTRVGILTTGSEIVHPGIPLRNGQIYNSNAFSIGAQAQQTGALVISSTIAADDEKIISEQLSQLFSQTQVILISGGVSAGDFDFVPSILKKLGVKLYFEAVAIQPGKPTVFGTFKDTLVFGLPGNPVSTFIIFEIFVRKIIYRTLGYQYTPTILHGILKETFKRKNTERTAFVPVRYHNDGYIETLEYHGSAHLHALSRANALLKIPAGTNEIPGGQTVHVRQI